VRGLTSKTTAAVKERQQAVKSKHMIRSALFSFCFILSVLVSAKDILPDNHSPQKNHYFICQFGYSNSIWGKTFGAKGCVSTLGFNPARFFSNRFVLGVVGDLKLLPGFGVFRPEDQFLADFNSGFVSPHGPGLDSANAQVVAVNLNSFGKHTYGIKGNSMFYFGAMVSLCPNKVGAILLQVKRGGVGYQAHQLIFENSAVPNISGNDKYPFTISKSWKYEITFKPQAFFEDVYIDVDDWSAGDFWKTISISLFYEKVNFKTAEFNDTKFSTFLTNEFMTKYAFDNRYGFKVGFSLY
jgi:hypothetical protein